MPDLRLSLDFHPGHDSEAKSAPVDWCKTLLNVETSPNDWVYEGWGIYTSLSPIITGEQWNEIKKNWESKYEGRVRGASASSAISS